MFDVEGGAERVEFMRARGGNLSQWLCDRCIRDGFSVSVMEARHVRTEFAAMRVKTNRQ